LRTKENKAYLAWDSIDENLFNLLEAEAQDSVVIGPTWPLFFGELNLEVDADAGSNLEYKLHQRSSAAREAKFHEITFLMVGRLMIRE
jgi:hypothetical protein